MTEQTMSEQTPAEPANVSYAHVVIEHADDTVYVIGVFSTLQYARDAMDASRNPGRSMSTVTVVVDREYRGTTAENAPFSLD
jgi:hypothetical protein